MIGIFPRGFGPRPGWRFRARGSLPLGLLLALVFSSSSLPGFCASSWRDLFQQGRSAYLGGDYTNAAALFRRSAAARPASGTLQNLGNAEWQIQRPGLAVLAWEQACWLNPFNQAARNNLDFARREAQLESPELAWYEVVSTWLPVNWWAWITGVSFWAALGLAALPAFLGLRKTGWQQGAAAFVLGVFLLSVPAHFGVTSRARLGFVLERNTPLRLTPTDDAQYLARLQSGEPARFERRYGKFVLVRTSRAEGWIEKTQLGLICPRD